MCVEMKTPEEIKRMLGNCEPDECDDCRYRAKCRIADARADLHADALEYINQLENQIGELTEKVTQLEAAHPKWISVDERLPDEGVKVLTLDRYGHVQDRFLYAFQGGPIVFRPDGMFPKKHVTHWMPMLEPPNDNGRD